MHSLYLLLDAILSLFTWLVIAYVILSWLITFDIVNPTNRVVYGVINFTQRLVEPLLQPIRRYLPHLGGVDISPVILLLIIYFLRNLLAEYWF